jgi:hypothetical protein
MTHHPIKVLPDGTRVYANYHRYTPVPDPRAVRFHGVWLLPLELLPEDERVLPATRPYRDPRRGTDPTGGSRRR